MSYIVGGEQKHRVIQILLKQQKGKCALCQQSLTHKFTNLDHIVPKSLGGPDLIWNFQATHRQCNSARRADPLCSPKAMKALANLRAYIAGGCEPEAV